MVVIWFGMVWGIRHKGNFASVISVGSFQVSRRVWHCWLFVEESIRRGVSWMAPWLACLCIRGGRRVGLARKTSFHFSC